jgi:lysine-specific demethylase/histidyl-hydroxylase NO66
MPRGTIHQAKAAPDVHSLHITVSVGQRNCWGDFLELAMPRALELASEDHIILRESLPRGYADYMGVAHSDEHDNPQRAAFIGKLMECMASVSQSIPWDSAADQLSVKFLQARLPLPGQEASKPPVKSNRKISGKSKVRLVAPDVARLVLEGDAVVVYHMLNNSRETHNEGDQEEEAEDPESGKRLVFTWEVAPALEELLSAFPEPVEVSSLAVSGEEIVTLVTELCDLGILVKV